MKCLLVVAAVALACSWTVSARGGGGGGGWDSYGYDSDSTDDGDNYEDFRACGRCACESRRGVGRTCRGNVGASIKGCPSTNSYISCQDTACSVLNCTAGQVWNSTLNACAACTAGQHVRADGQLCVCDQGTKFNRTSGACSPCPTGATEEADRCYCPTGTVLDRANNACKACPSGSIIDRYSSKCACIAATPRTYWSVGEWTCKACPGTATTVQLRRRTEEVCTCTGANEIFDLKSVSCITCPNTATAYAGKKCRCNIRGQRFDRVSKTCVCYPGYVLNAAGTACQLGAAAATTTTEATTRGQINP